MGVPQLHTPPSSHRVAANIDPGPSPGTAALVDTGHSEHWAGQTADKVSIHTIPGKDTWECGITGRYRQLMKVRYG